MGQETVLCESGEQFRLVVEVGTHSSKSSRVFYAKDQKGESLCLKVAERDLCAEYDVIKELSDAVAADNTLARALPKIPRPYSCGRLEINGERRNYLAREFITGSMMTYFFMNHEAFSSQAERIAAAIDAVCSAAVVVRYIHARGQYDGDLKPDDFVLNKNGAHLVDFDTVAGEGTSSGRANRLFSAPELAISSPEMPGFRADIYSMGKIMFALAAAHNSRAWDSFVLNYSGYTESEINEMCNVGIPPGLMAAVKRAVSYKPLERHGSIDEFVAELNDAKCRMMQKG